VRAEIKAGELLREMAETVQRKVHGDATSQVAMSLADLGLSRDESSRFQQAAAAPREAVE
jgi:hypothetical protein